jgi:hypothetical protein
MPGSSKWLLASGFPTKGNLTRRIKNKAKIRKRRGEK